MASIEIVAMMKTLRTERSHTRKELKKLDKVISALRELSSTNSTTPNGRRHRMSRRLAGRLVRHNGNDGRNTIKSEPKG
jgi:YD repeat-containing protein